MSVCLFGFLRSSSTTRLYYGRVSRLTPDNFTCYHTRYTEGRPRLLSQLSHYTNTDPTSREQGGDSGDRTQDLLIKSCALLSTDLPPRHDTRHTPGLHGDEAKFAKWSQSDKAYLQNSLFLSGLKFFIFQIKIKREKITVGLFVV